MAERDRRPTRAPNSAAAAKSVTGKTSKSDPKRSATPAKPAASNSKANTAKEKRTKPKAAPKLVKRGAPNATAKPAPANKSAPVSKLRPGQNSPAGTSRTPKKSTILEWLLNEPEQLGHLLHNRPGWLDELLAIGLIVIGLVMFVSPLGRTAAGAATLASTVSDSLRTLVGLGGMLVLAVLIMAAGLRIVLMRLGIILRLSWQRVIGAEVAYIAFLALLHLLAHDPEPRALARAGGGGGYVGWAVSELIRGLFGSSLAIIAFIVILIVALGLSVGIRRPHLRQSLVWLKTRADALATRTTERLASLSPPPVFTASTPDPNFSAQSSAATAGSSRPSRRTDTPMARPLNPPPNSVPTPSSGANPVSSQPSPSPLPPDPAPPAPTASTPSTTAAGPSANPTTPQTVPQPAPAKSIGSTRMVLPHPSEEAPRRVKRFGVADFKENRRTLKLADGQPPLTLLDDTELNRPSEDEINTNARIIENTLLEFDIDVEVVDVKVGPTVTQYAVQPFREVTDA